MPLDLTPNQPPYYQIVDGPAPAGTKYYIANLTQSGTNAPVATIMQNTLGEVPIWSRNDIGEYLLTTVGEVFSELKTTMLISGLNQGFAYYTYGDTTWLELRTRSLAGALSDDYLGGYTTVMITVIP